MFKRVHFAPINRIYSPGSMPSPTLTDSSLPSSSPGLFTPPPEEDEYIHAVYPRTPYTQAMDLYPEYQEYIAPKPLQIHVLLAFAPNSDPAFDYDLANSPINGDGQYPIQAFNDNATSPPMTSIIILHSLLSSEIEVNSPSGSPLTVGDVLSAIYRHLRLAIHPVEYSNLPDGERREAVDAAYYVRCGAIRNSAERLAEERKGIKRIDLLMGCSRFMGLSGTLDGPGVWELNIA
ncbi:hypothetical protein BDN70DRAFT_187992 [Pholiota conissans]|uniref:DUF6699 domain-containing protein n=1 Tax=Pholiota conissans TaxID=109636 RepID=A0A9P5YV26_9AGAR|nr:hypothetical protein BDN70DRAFT_187992 [Pholiota conissans]